VNSLCRFRFSGVKPAFFRTARPTWRISKISNFCRQTFTALQHPRLNVLPMRLLLVTDAWEPQTNGVVNTLRETCRELVAMGITVERISPERFRTIACPSYPEIRLAVLAQREVDATFCRVVPEAVHIATEGPLGHAARASCLRLGMRFTTSYHTRFPEYLRARWPLPLDVSYRYLRWFHGAAAHTMVATSSMELALRARGFRNLRRWSRGVDTLRFRPNPDRPATDVPTFVFVGRVFNGEDSAARGKSLCFIV
jgi:glycosyltransferase involved in cell wall biosynthesis